jgi:hypothetical protein
MTATSNHVDGQDIATLSRLPEPSPLTVVAILQALVASRQEEVGSPSMYRLLVDAGIPSDGWAACTILERLGALTPINDGPDLQRRWRVNPKLHDALLVKIQAQLFLDAVREAL